MIEDENILKLVADGNSNAFASLYAAYSSMVYNTALSFCPHVGMAEDVAQEVFTKVYRHAGKFEGRSSVKTWIYRITVNTAIQTKQRPRNRQFAELSDQSSVLHHPGIELEKSEKARYLMSAIDKLPTNQRTAFTLSFLEELPRQEVADIMEITLKATESLLQRAKAKLRILLREIYLQEFNT